MGLLDRALEMTKPEPKATVREPTKPPVKRHDARHPRNGRFIRVRNGKVVP